MNLILPTNIWKSWPQIPSEDLAALDDLNVFLVSCLNMLSEMDHLNQLISLNEIKSIIMKLPFELRKNSEMRLLIRARFVNKLILKPW